MYNNCIYIINNKSTDAYEICVYDLQNIKLIKESIIYDKQNGIATLSIFNEIIYVCEINRLNGFPANRGDVS